MTAFSTEMPSSTRSMVWSPRRWPRRRRARASGPNCDGGEHGDGRVDDEHELTDAEREPAATAAARRCRCRRCCRRALKTRPMPRPDDRAAVQRGEQQVVVRERRHERREHVDEDGERRPRRRPSCRVAQPRANRHATSSRIAFMTSIWTPTGIVTPRRRLRRVVDDGRETRDAAGGDLVRDEERVERPRGHDEHAEGHERVVAHAAALQDALDYHQRPSPLRRVIDVRRRCAVRRTATPTRRRRRGAAARACASRCASTDSASRFTMRSSASPISSATASGGLEAADVSA